MNRRRFVFASTVSLLAVTVALAGVAFYSNFSANASGQTVPNAISYFPADTNAIFGMNVPRFLASPVYAQIMQKHGQEIDKDLGDFMAKTGVDPSKFDYIIAAARPGLQKGTGAVIAVGSFNQDSIISFINTRGTPIKVDYKRGTVLMIPEVNKLEKGIAFLSGGEIALGDLDSLKAILDVQDSGSDNIYKNPAMSDLLGKLSAGEMFWFAGDASILTKIPTGTSLVPNLSAIQNVFGTLNLDTTIIGKVTVTAKDGTAAGQLADFAKGLVALGNMMSGQNPDLAELIRDVRIDHSNDSNQFDVSITIPFNLLQKFDNAKPAFRAGVGK